MSSDAAVAGRLVGRTLGHFRIVEVIGAGAMGVVYRAVDERLHREVALKVLAEESVRDESKRRRFLREARSGAAVNHANVATIHDVGEAEGLVYIAMELVVGTTLEDELARARMLVPEAIRIARGIARALAKAHERGIVHRDLKPENVMIGEDGEVKVLDFGLAKLLAPENDARIVRQREETSSRTTLEGRVIGTPAYMSPEQAMGRPLDTRTDVFSFGTLLYEMLTGLRPFFGASPVATMVAVTRDAPPPLRSVVPTIPEALAQIVTTCLEKEPSKRFPNGRAVVMALDAFDPASNSTSPPALAVPGAAPALPVLAPPAAKMRRATVALVAAGILAALLAAFALGRVL